MNPTSTKYENIIKRIVETVAGVVNMGGKRRSGS
jgi:hypothetical protein